MISTVSSEETPALESGPDMPDLGRWSSYVPIGRRTPMQHDIWIRACYEVLYRHDKAVVIETPHGIGAFARKGRLPPTLHLVGAEELAEPVEAVAASREGAEELIDQLLDIGLPVRFGHHPSDTIISDVLFEKASARGILLRKSVPGSPYISLDSSWKEPVDRFNSRRRSDFRRMRRRAEQDGPVTFEFHQPTQAEVLPFLEKAVDVEARSWKSRSRTALADNAEQRDFFNVYGKLASAAGIFRVNFMKIGTEIVAMQIAAECDDGYWLFKIGYDEKYARCSPGMLMMLESIRHAASRDLKTFEFLGKSAEWTKFWTENERPNCSLRYYPHNAYGYLALGRDAAIIAGRRAANAFEDAIRSLRKERS